MKNLKFYLIALPALFLLISAIPADIAPAAAKLKYPKKVNTIIQDKCYGCHSPGGRSEKVKEKLNWDVLPTLPAAEQAEKLESIVKILEEGKMPPAKFLENNPDSKLTEKESEKLRKWAQKAAKKAAK